MGKVIASCAPPGVGIGTNLGMDTVDLALHSIIEEAGISDSVKLFRPWKPYIKDQDGNYPRNYYLDQWPMDVNYSMENLGGDLDADAYLYWGDFQHGKDYLSSSAKRMRAAYKREYDVEVPYESCLDKCFSYFLQEKKIAGERNPAVAAYGGTLFQNRITDYSDERYANALKAFYRSARMAKARDVYSANKIAEIRGDYQTSYLGLDAALLNRREELLRLPQSETREVDRYSGTLGVFLGSRSSRSFPWLGLIQFLRGLANQLNMQMSWIHWDRHGGGLVGSRFNILKPFLSRPVHVDDDIDMYSGDVIASIDKASLVVTDTYHLALNALVLGKPAVCIFEPSSPDVRNANMGFRTAWRDKRVMFYLTWDLADFLVSSSDLKKGKFRRGRVENIAELVQEGNKINTMFTSLQHASSEDRSMVTEHLKAMVRD